MGSRPWPGQRRDACAGRGDHQLAQMAVGVGCALGASVQAAVRCSASIGTPGRVARPPADVLMAGLTAKPTASTRM